MPVPTPRHAHRRTESSPAAVPRATDDLKPPLNSRIITSVRRTLSTTKRRDPVPTPTLMYSTLVERTPYTSSRFRYDPATARPTVEQIAMGLHLSRTPHLSRPPSKSPTPPTPKPIPRAPPPARSSLKKPGLSASTALLNGPTSSTTDVTSTAPSTPHSSEHSSGSLRARMARFLPHRVHPSASTPSSSALSSPQTSTSELNHTRKKAVRFSSLEEED
ncbi:hypothetical protein GGX14DRAFT_650093 [Mycena pura]|uniref:Uncharacterized protein n=1 Tax=Mycena pura TaxID=153505 RepID=A0AAD6YNA6_9AGAR|nr:hypothetical protein GGX14DRAFT_650093 [Mycena pura]